MTVPRFDPAVLGNDPGRRSTILEIFEGALTEVEPDRAVHRSLRRRDAALEVAGARFELADVNRVILLAFGKAAPAMTRAACDELRGFDVGGLVVSNHAEPVPDGLDLRVTGHPLPDERSALAARAALDLLAGAGPDDLVLCLISGGGSALLELPAAGISLAEEQATVDVLLSSGADIYELNTVRKHLSAVKGGRLAQAADPAFLCTLILSDVVGSPLDVIASGPSVPDPTTYLDALAVLDRYELRRRVPAAVVEHLERGRDSGIAETPKSPYPRQVVAVIGDGAAAAKGAAATARRAGLPVTIATTTLTGDARVQALRCLEQSEAGVTIFAGETTVKVTGRGRGGRNQEAALAAALEISGDESTVFAALGTDGIDGPTEAAGAIVDGNTVARGSKLSLNAQRYLGDNDSGTYLAATEDLLISGPTGTNVGDLWLVARD